jgi:hypothetical protein
MKRDFKSPQIPGPCVTIIFLLERYPEDLHTYTFSMPSWTHLIRFVAVEDNQSHIGQLVDTNRDAGLDSFQGREIKAYLINGTIFDGEVTKTQLTVKYVSSFAHAY